MLINRLTQGDSVLRHNQIIHSPGRTFTYQVIGPCCRLYDREQLPWPSCSLSWRGKQPSWRRVGRRFVLDVGSKNHPNYAVRLLGRDAASEPMLLTLYWLNLSASDRDWWYGKKPGSAAAMAKHAPAPVAVPEAEPAFLVGELV